MSLRYTKKKQTIIPQTRGGYCPTLTSVYELVSAANLISVAHFPKPCVLEEYEYEEEHKEHTDKRCDGHQQNHHVDL